MRIIKNQEGKLDTTLALKAKMVKRTNHKEEEEEGNENEDITDEEKQAL